MDEVNDNVTLVALGSINEVVIEVVDKERTQRVFRLLRPTHYPSDNLNKIASFPETLPCLTWGQGRTPNF
jgi:hypothetical protein